MKKKTIIALAALLAMGQGVWAQSNIGSITWNKDGYYEIKNEDALKDLAVYVNGDGIYSTGGESETEPHKCSGLTFKVTDNITFTVPTESGTSNFTPIGSCKNENEPETGSFQGTFDGGGFTISGIRVCQSTESYVGLFGNSNHATIQNVRLSNCQFTGQAIVGGIVAAETNDTPVGIVNCHVDNTVKVIAVGDDEYDGYVGGIAGMYQYATISYCSSEAEVTGSQYVGGIVGLLTRNPARGGDVSSCSSIGVMVGRVYVEGKLEGDSDYDCIALIDDADNSAVLSAYNNKIDNVTLIGRTLYKDGHWNTLCLPFDASLTGDFAGAEIRTLSTATFSDGTLTLNFTPASGEGAVTSIKAGKPYIIKWTSGDNFTPTFTGVTINSADPTDVTGTAANFHGIYTPYSTGGENKSMLYLGASNTLYYPNANMTINAFRAYFTLNNGIEAGTPNNQTTNPVRAFVLNFGDEQTGIVSLSADSKDLKDCAAWYTPGGVRLDGKPSRAGVYINNGKKVVIK